MWFPCEVSSAPPLLGAPGDSQAPCGAPAAHPSSHDVRLTRLSSLLQDDDTERVVGVELLQADGGTETGRSTADDTDVDLVGRTLDLVGVEGLLGLRLGGVEAGAGAEGVAVDGDTRPGGGGGEPGPGRSDPALSKGHGVSSLVALGSWEERDNSEMRSVERRAQEMLGGCVVVYGGGPAPRPRPVNHAARHWPGRARDDKGPVSRADARRWSEYLLPPSDTNSRSLPHPGARGRTARAEFRMLRA